VKPFLNILLCGLFVCFWHDANGNNTFEGTRVRVAYNEINLPQQVQLLGGRGIKNVYTADGRKLKSEAKQGSEYIKEGTKTYSGNLVFDTNDELEYILFDEGRILYNVDDSTFNYEYHLKDHLGSTRVAFVPQAQGTEVVQENSYYPFGAPIADLSWSPKSTNRYLREGKEYISDFDWNKYDFTGRTFDSWTVQALQIDPMAAKYYSTSPYGLWGNNPLRVIDPTGMWLDDPENSSWWDNLKQFFSYFGIGTTHPEDKEPDTKQSNQKHDNYAKLRGLSNTMNENKEAAQEALDYIPFVGAVSRMSEGAIEDNNATFAAGMGMLLIDAAGGELLKGAGKAVAKGMSVIGPRNVYREFAKKMGANFLNVTDEAWTWAKNEKYLAGIVKRGDDVIFAGKFDINKFNPNTSLGREIQYLQRHGYSWNSDFTRLIKK
jgi:RHS repeat-associated protein